MVVLSVYADFWGGTLQASWIFQSLLLWISKTLQGPAPMKEDRQLMNHTMGTIQYTWQVGIVGFCSMDFSFA